MAETADNPKWEWEWHAQEYDDSRSLREILKGNYKFTKFRSGKQGVVGLLEFSSGKYIVKMSKYMNMICVHEYNIMKSLESMHSYCPYFGRVVSLEHVAVDPDFNLKECEDPFKVEGDHYMVDVLCMQYIEDARRMYSLIRHKEVPEYIIASLIKQTVLAIYLAQSACKFVHYDIHSGNILVRKCDKDLVITCKLPESDTIVTIPTYGYYPVIIDYGFAYAYGADNTLLTPVNYMREGYMSADYDSFADLRIFLVSVLDDLIDFRDVETSELIKKMDDVCYRLYGSISIDWESGWIKNNRGSWAEWLENILVRYSSKSTAFDLLNGDRLGDFLDYIQILIDMPLIDDGVQKTSLEFLRYDWYGDCAKSGKEDEDAGTLFKKMRGIVLGNGIDPVVRHKWETELIMVYKEILVQFVKIENALKYEDDAIYVMRHICLAALGVKHRYLAACEHNNANVRRMLVCEFKYMVCKCLNVKFKTNWEKLLCSLFLFADAVKRCMLYEYVYRHAFLVQEYRKMPVKTAYDHWPYVLEATSVSTYTCNERTRVICLNVDNGTMTVKHVPNETSLDDVYNTPSIRCESFEQCTEEYLDIPNSDIEDSSSSSSSSSSRSSRSSHSSTDTMSTLSSYTSTVYSWSEFDS